MKLRDFINEMEAPTNAGGGDVKAPAKEQTISNVKVGYKKGLEDAVKVIAKKYPAITFEDKGTMVFIKLGGTLLAKIPVAQAPKQTVESYVSEMAMRSFNNQQQIFDYLNSVKSKKVNPDMESISSAIKWILDNRQDKVMATELRTLANLKRTLGTSLAGKSKAQIKQLS